ncbi:MAG TPA: hypothetical protein VLH75_03150 [Longimicrobiales bacterium]|nr:hypothetical protein [Longimicrobiales bacterium]
MTPAEAVRRRELLRDSQATLRQVESVLSGLGSPSAAGGDRQQRVERVVSTLEGRRAGLRDLVWVLVNTYVEITSVVEALRRSRGLMEQAAMERLQSTHEKLAEVSSATEMAATGMLDGLDRALALVDRLGGSAAADTDGEGDVREQLRDELHAMMNLLQFQDLTSQQLGYANGVLLDIEQRMVELSRVFDLRWLTGDDGAAGEPQPEREPSCPVTCDPHASHFNAESRQALADEIFR